MLHVDDEYAELLRLVEEFKHLASFTPDCIEIDAFRIMCAMHGCKRHKAGDEEVLVMDVTMN